MACSPCDYSLTAVFCQPPRVKMVSHYGKINSGKELQLLHVFIGADDYSIRQALSEIKKGIGDATALMTNTTNLDGKQVTMEHLRAACETVPFLADKRLVIVEGLLERFEAKAKTGKKKASRQPEQPEEYVTIAEAMKKLPPFTECVILGGEISERNPLRRELATFTKIRSFPLMNKPQLSQWVEQRVALQAKGGGISPNALALLVRFVGNDLWKMAGEVDKLIQFAGARRIEEADVKAAVSDAQEANVFAMVDAVMESRTGAAQELLQQQFKDGAAPAQLLTMLARQLRIIFQVKEMRSRGMARAIIQTKLGLNAEFLLNKAWAQADKYSIERLREAFHKILEADLAIKTGKMEGEIALDILVAELGQKVAVPAK
jgi:DNA polymerase III subunit delta